MPLLARCTEKKKRETHVELSPNISQVKEENFRNKLFYSINFYHQRAVVPLFLLELFGGTLNHMHLTITCNVQICFFIFFSKKKKLEAPFGMKVLQRRLNSIHYLNQIF